GVDPLPHQKRGRRRRHRTHARRLGAVMDPVTLWGIKVPLSELVTANQREHWAPKARKTKALRWQGRIAASRAASWHGPLPYCHIEIAVGWPDKSRRDVHNIMPTIKALIDGCVDAGLLADDSDQHIQGPDL